MIERFFGDNYIEGFRITGINLSGATAKLTVARRKTSEVDERMFQIIGAIVDASAGDINFEYNNDEELTPVGVYYYEVEITTALNEKRVVDYGDYIVLRGISK